jgi:DNA-binding Lrp family transcriptional regulator
MRPIDFRNETFRDLAARVDSDRQTVLDALRRLGPSTTRSLSERMGMSILTVRPRCTELLQLGAVELHGREGHEGVYRARTDYEWVTWYEAEHRAATGGDQMMLKV